MGCDAPRAADQVTHIFIGGVMDVTHEMFEVLP
jgi:hypothetical protein